MVRDLIPHGFVRRHAVLLLASIALAIGLGWILQSGALPLLPPTDAPAPTPVPLVGFIVLMVFHIVVRFARCQLLILPFASVPMIRILSINGIAMACITFLPFRLGEVVRPAMLREREKLSLIAVSGTVAAERIVDGVVLSGMLLIGLALAAPRLPLPTHIGELPVPAAIVPRAARVATGGFALAFLVMVLFYGWRSLARRVTAKVVGRFSPRAAERLTGMLERLSDGLGFLSNARHAAPYLLVTLIAVASQVWAIDLLADAVGLRELTFAEASVVVGVLGLGFALPNAPGFFGGVQVALYAGLAIYIDPAKVVREGAALVFVFYVTYLGIVIVGAVISVIIENRRRRARASPNSVQADIAGV